jgi:glycosyltransferase involved in cell wall biosynthesis
VHVMFVTQYFPPEIGATQTRIYEFARACVRRGHRVTVLTEFPNHPHGRIPMNFRGRIFTREEMDGFVVERVWVRASPVKTSSSRLLFYLSFLVMATMRGVSLRDRIDIVVATSPPLLVGLAGWLVAWRQRARFVLDIRDLWPAAAEALGELSDPTLLRIAGLLERFLYARADRITAVTRSFVAAIRRSVRDRRAVTYVPNGAATEMFAPTTVDPRLRSRLGWDGRFVATFAGNMGIAQGLGAVLEAAKELANENAMICFLGDGPVKAELMASANSSRLSNVCFLHAVPTAEVAPYLLASDALLVTLNRAEVFDMFVPSKLFDSLACGRPVILMANGEAREILEASRAGISVAPEDPLGLAAAVRALAALSPAERNELGTRGRDYVLKNFLRDTQNRRMVDLIEQVVSAHS